MSNPYAPYPETRHEVGVDLIEIARIVHVLGRFPERFRQRVLTDREQRYCGKRVERIAGRWAAKEAVSKVLGLGVRGVGWREIEILPNRRGKPLVYLHGKAKKRAETLGMGQPEVSLTHSDTLAFAFVVAPVQDETDYDEEKSLLIERMVRRGLL